MPNDPLKELEEWLEENIALVCVDSHERTLSPDEYLAYTSHDNAFKLVLAKIAEMRENKK